MTMGQVCMHACYMSSADMGEKIYSQDKRGNKAREKRCHGCNGNFTE